MTTATQEPLSVSQADAARMLNLTVQTIRRWELKGLIQGRRVNNGKRFYSYARLKQLAHGEDHGQQAQG